MAHHRLRRGVVELENAREAIARRCPTWHCDKQRIEFHAQQFLPTIELVRYAKLTYITKVNPVISRHA
jgi:hypothetical protein